MDIGGHFSAFTDIEKKPIFAHTVNFYQYFQKVSLHLEAFSICTDLSRISQENGHYLDARKMGRSPSHHASAWFGCS
jgi:hypothetical protein